MLIYDDYKRVHYSKNQNIQKPMHRTSLMEVKREKVQVLNTLENQNLALPFKKQYNEILKMLLTNFT